MSQKKFKPEGQVGGEEALENAANIARRSVDQAQAAFEKASEVAHENVQVLDAAAVAYKTRFADLQMKAMENTQANMGAAFEFTRKLFAVKEPAAAFQLQQDFARDQFALFQKQFTEINNLSLALAKDTMKPVQENFAKGFAGFSKPLAG
ncbi:MAG: hypothetical protein HC855_02845 [Rhizobiales bacterium]|nr:hypothetical protein [Hyphomicrobiales bacterium]